jgi:hypothetical protein
VLLRLCGTLSDPAYLHHWEDVDVGANEQFRPAGSMLRWYELRKWGLYLEFSQLVLILGSE